MGVRRSAIVAALALPLTLTGCGTPAKEASPATTTTAAPTPSADPVKGACYRLSFDDATSPTPNTRPVPCKRRHTSVTFHVGHFDPVIDGHLVAVDSAAVQSQIANRCRQALPLWVGGTPESLALSRIRPIWFSPTVADGDAGATWFRCDLVVVKGQDQLAALPKGQGRGLLAEGPGDFGTCASGDPSRPTTKLVICGQRHSWKAVTATQFPEGTKFMGKAATQAASAACKTIAADSAADPLDYSYSFQWPTKEAWKAGDRMGLCWVPVS